MRKPITATFRNLSSRPEGDTHATGEAVVNPTEMTMTLSFKQPDGQQYLITGKANGIGTFEGESPASSVQQIDKYRAEWRQLNECTYTGIWTEGGQTWLFMVEVEEL